jgi:hypothetical protein
VGRVCVASARLRHHGIVVPSYTDLKTIFWGSAPGLGNTAGTKRQKLAKHPSTEMPRLIDGAVRLLCALRVFVWSGCICRARKGQVAWPVGCRSIGSWQWSPPLHRHYTSPSGENEVLTDLFLFALARVCMIRGLSVNAAKSGLRGTLLPSDVVGISSGKPRKCCDLDVARTLCLQLCCCLFLRVCV